MAARLLNRGPQSFVVYSVVLALTTSVDASMAQQPGLAVRGRAVVAKRGTAQPRPALVSAAELRSGLIDAGLTPEAMTKAGLSVRSVSQVVHAAKSYLEEHHVIWRDVIGHHAQVADVWNEIRDRGKEYSRTSEYAVKQANFVAAANRKEIMVDRLFEAAVVGLVKEEVDSLQGLDALPLSWPFSVTAKRLPGQSQSAGGPVPTSDGEVCHGSNVEELEQNRLEEIRAVWEQAIIESAVSNANEATANSSVGAQVR